MGFISPLKRRNLISGFYYIARQITLTNPKKPMSTAITKTKHPRGLYVLFMTEMWERFGYYLMVGIFFLYMVDPLSNGGLGFSKGKALDIVGTYVALVYLAPFLGGLIADRLIGYRKAILLGGIMMSAGY